MALPSVEVPVPPLAPNGQGPWGGATPGSGAPFSLPAVSPPPTGADATTFQQDFDRLFHQSDTFFERAMQEQEKANKTRDEEAKQLRMGADERRKMADAIAGSEHPKIPDSAKLPSAPDDDKRKPVDAFGSVLGALAVLASLKSRRPMVDAMNAISGVIKGASKGLDEKRAAQLDIFHAKMDEAYKQNEAEMQRYTAILNDHKLTVDEKNAQLEAYMAANKDEVAATEVQAKGHEALTDLLLKRLDLGFKLAEAQERLMAMQGNASGGTITPEAVANYQVRMPSGWTLRALGGMGFYDQVLKINPNYSEPRYTEIQKAVNEFSQAGQSGKRVTAIKTDLQHLDVLGNLAKVLDNGNIQQFNRIRQSASEQLGSPIPTNFDAAKDYVADETVKAILNNGIGGVKDREAAQAIFDRAKAEGQTSGAIITVQKLLVGQIKSLKSTYEGNTSGARGIPNFEETVGLPRDFIEKLEQSAGSDGGNTPTVSTQAQYDALPQGAVYTGTDGQTYRKP